MAADLPKVNPPSSSPRRAPTRGWLVCLLISAAVTQIDWWAAAGFSNPDPLRHGSMSRPESTWVERHGLVHSKRVRPPGAGGRGVSNSGVAPTFSSDSASATRYLALPDSDYSDPAARKALNADSLSRGLLIRQYENAVLEIRARLEHENLLFSLKFTLVGAILGLLIADYVKKSTRRRRQLEIFGSPLAALLLWSAVITSAIIDSRIHYNADIIMSLGDWIRKDVEMAIHPIFVTGWETYLAFISPLFRSHLYPVLRANANVLTLILLAAATFLYSGRTTSSTRSRLVARICRYGCTMAMVVFMLVGLHFGLISLTWVLITIAFSAFGIICAFRFWRA
jgi:hypothetical protein